jgi:protein gp37
MADKSKIEWTDATFNPWIGCTKVGPGCDNCYAARQDAFRHWTPAGWGAGQPRKRTKTWGAPMKWNAEPFVECIPCGWRGEKRAFFQVDPQGVRHTMCPSCASSDWAGARRRVFCASLADIFDNEIDPAWRVDLFSLIRSTPNLDWLLLTKRIGNAHEMIVDAIEHELDMGADPAFDKVPWPNVWLGATIVNQEEADRDIIKLMATPAAVRFLSMEPLLGLPTISDFLMPPAKLPGRHQQLRAGEWIVDVEDGHMMWRGLDWVIAGGESGPGARPMHPDWAKSLRDQCQAAGVPFLFKQWGDWAPRDLWSYHAKRQCAIHLDGTEVSHDDAPQDVGGHRFEHVGKKTAGRLLDGREWNEFPEVRPCSPTMEAAQ